MIWQQQVSSKPDLGMLRDGVCVVGFERPNATSDSSGLLPNGKSLCAEPQSLQLWTRNSPYLSLEQAAKVEEIM